MKTLFPLFLAWSFLLSASLSFGGPCIETDKGDLSGDGAIGVADAVAGLEICAGSDEHAPPPTADVDGNEKIGLEDVVYALQVASEIRPDIPSIESRLAPELQHAGSGLDIYPTTGEYDLAPFVFRNNLGPNGSDEITIRFVSESSDPCGENPDPMSGVSMRCDLLPGLTLLDAVSSFSTELSVVEDLTAAPYSAWDDGCYCQGSIFEASQIRLPILLKTPSDAEPAVAEGLTITAIQTGVFSRVQFRSFLDENGDMVENRLENPFPAGSTVSFFPDRPIETVRFFVSSTHGLMRESNFDASPSPLFENVRNLQFAFGVDEDGDGLVDDWIGDDPADSFDADGDVPGAEKKKVASICLVRIE